MTDATYSSGDGSDARAALREAADLRTERDALRATLEIIAQHAGYTLLHPDADASPDVQRAYSEGVAAGYESLATFASKALSAGQE